MADNAQSETTKTPAAGMRSEIQQKWSKFSSQEIDALKDKDALVAAQRDVDAFAGGRQL